MIPAAVLLGFLAALLAWAALGDAQVRLGKRILERLPSLSTRWERMARGLGLPPEVPVRKAGASALILAATLPLGLAWGPAFLLLGLLAAALPPMSLERAWSSRSRRVERDLPWILDFLRMGVQAGMDFEASLERAARVRPGPLGAEIQELLSRIRVGVARRKALEEWGEASAVSSVRSLAGALVQADALGVSLSPVLLSQAEAARTRQMQRAEALAQKAPVKLLFPLALCILPVTFLVLFGPIFLTVMP